MFAKYNTTLNAINRGIGRTDPTKGVYLLEDWEAAVARADVDGSELILSDLALLRKQLERGAPNSDRVYELLYRLGKSTVQIADKAFGSKILLKALGEALMQAGRESVDEKEDEEAAANPRRGPKVA